jgi:hypothetical protein
MRSKFIACSLSLLAASSTLAAADDLGTSRGKNLPVSNGSAGSFDAQFHDGNGLVWMNTDTGVVWDAASGGFVAFTLPFKVVKWNGQTFNAYNFTDMTVEPTVNLTIYGTNPAMFLSKRDINFAGKFTIAAAAGAGGAAPDQNTPPYNGGTGTSATNTAGGGGGSGPIGGVQGQCSPEVVTAGGGGGGGNATHGQPGLPGNYPVDAGGTPQNDPPGPGGLRISANKLVGGGGGGAGGGGFWSGDFYGQPGANGGGAVIFSSSKGSITIASGAVIDASGADGAVSNGGSGSSGGGAGGDEWFYATGSFTNNGSLLMHGGAGGKSQYTSGCFNPVTVEGPDGGNGAGGQLEVHAATLDNAGLIDVSDGGRATSHGGSVELIGDVTRRGRIKGLGN